MRSIGLTNFGYKRQLEDWLELSIQKNVPISLLIMSRAFYLTSTSAAPEEVLKSSISSLTDQTINEVVLAAASPTEANSVEMKKRKLESLTFQNEMISEERNAISQSIKNTETVSKVSEPLAVASAENSAPAVTPEPSVSAESAAAVPETKPEGVGYILFMI